MELKYVNCPTNHIAFGDIDDMVQVGSCLILKQDDKLTVWDISNPLELKQVNEYSLPFRGLMKLIGNSLYLWTSDLDTHSEGFNKSDTDTYQYKTSLVSLNVSNPLNIKENIPFEVDSKYGLPNFIEHNGRYFLCTNTEIFEYRNGKKIVLFEKPQANHYEPITNLLAFEDKLVSVGQGDGVRVFRIAENSLVQLKYLPTQFQMPNALSWDIPGKTFFTIGLFEQIFKYDMTVPEKTKRLKGAKTDAIDVCSQYVRKDDTLFVFGLKATNGQPHEIPVIYEVDAKVPAIIAKHVIKEYEKKGRMGADRPAGIIQFGDYLLLSTPYREIGVVKIS
jgi:hypothetical protein